MVSVVVLVVVAGGGVVAVRWRVSGLTMYGGGRPSIEFHPQYKFILKQAIAFLKRLN